MAFARTLGGCSAWPSAIRRSARGRWLLWRAVRLAGAIGLIFWAISLSDAVAVVGLLGRNFCSRAAWPWRGTRIGQRDAPPVSQWPLRWTSLAQHSWPAFCPTPPTSNAPSPTRSRTKSSAERARRRSRLPARRSTPALWRGGVNPGPLGLDVPVGRGGPGQGHRPQLLGDRPVAVRLAVRRYHVPGRPPARPSASSRSCRSDSSSRSPTGGTLCGCTAGPTADVRPGLAVGKRSDKLLELRKGRVESGGPSGAGA